MALQLAKEDRESPSGLDWRIRMKMEELKRSKANLQREIQEKEYQEFLEFLEFKKYRTMSS